MKVIPKKQKGGSFDSFFTTYLPVQDLPMQSSKSQSSTQESSDSEKEKLTEKDFFDMIKDIDGLPNEMQNIVTNLINTFQLSNLTGASPEDLSVSYLSNLYQLKIAAQNKKRYDDVITKASKNGSLAEPAISMDGKLLVQTDDGGISKLSLSEFNNNKELYSDRLLTVSNLANMRKYDPSLVKDQSIFEMIENSMGYESFQDLLSKSVQQLGSSETSSTGMFSAEGQASKGLALLQSLREDDRIKALGSVTAEGLYGYNIIDKNQLKQINYLTQYITTTLPDRAKTWAAIKTGSDNKNKATQNLVFNYLLGQSTDSHSFDIQYKGSLEDSSSSSSKSKTKEDDSKMTFLTALQNGYGERTEVRSLNVGNNTNFKVTGSVYSGFVNQEGKTISNVNLQQLLTDTGILGISNVQSITFGDNVINPNSLQNIAVENTGGFRAVLPIIKQGNKVIPNFELMTQFDKLVQQVNDELGQNSSYENRMNLLERKIQGIPAMQELLTITGKLDPNKFQPFLIVDGIASDRNFSFTSKTGASISDEVNPLISETDNGQDKEYFKQITKPEDFDDDSIYPWDWFSNYDKLYKSNVFIPLQTNNRLAAIIFSGQKVSTDTAYKIQKEYQQFNNKMNNTSSNMLFQ